MSKKFNKKQLKKMNKSVSAGAVVTREIKTAKVVALTKDAKASKPLSGKTALVTDSAKVVKKPSVKVR